jgi:hypothetical protein
MDKFRKMIVPNGPDGWVKLPEDIKHDSYNGQVLVTETDSGNFGRIQFLADWKVINNRIPTDKEMYRNGIQMLIMTSSVGFMFAIFYYISLNAVWGFSLLFWFSMFAFSGALWITYEFRKYLLPSFFKKV